MPISSSDIQLRTSNAAGSVGGGMAGSTVVNDVNNNVWPDVTDAERIAGGERFRKVFWRNNSALEAALRPVLYSPVLPTGSSLSLGLGIDSDDDADPAQGNMSPLSATSPIAAISDGADVRGLTIWGLDNAGTPAPLVATLLLTGTSEVVTAAIWTQVFAVAVDAVDAARTVTLRQGLAGPAIGSIPVGRRMAWRWLTGASAKASGIRLPDLPAGGAYGMWMKLAWTAGTSAVRPDTMSVTFEEDA